MYLNTLARSECLQCSHQALPASVTDHGVFVHAFFADENCCMKSRYSIFFVLHGTLVSPHMPGFVCVGGWWKWQP